ncbi:MAG TPA: dihydroorotate dehydrogenase [Acidimicrobiia bacterium]|jgi:dihydroorotate dehydrogenase (NAD+) catalytic subunit
MPRRSAVRVDLSTALGPIALPNPIIAASGTFGHGDEVARIGSAAELGAVTVKSLHAEPWPGNPAPRLHATSGGGMLNSVGLQGPGIEHWVEHELPGLVASGARVIGSVWGRTVDEFARGAKMLLGASAHLVAIEVNVSCPNLEDGKRMFAHSAIATREAVEAVLAAGTGLPVFAKLSPNTYELVDIAGAALDAGATGLTLVNTVLGFGIDAETRRPVLGAGGGGLSGPPVKAVALRAVHDVTGAFPDAPVIGTGGVMHGVDAIEMMLAGASAVGVGTATFRDPRAALHIRDEMARWCAEHGVARVRDLVGALEER